MSLFGSGSCATIEASKKKSSGMKKRGDQIQSANREEIAEQIRFDIMHGVLRFGEKLSEATYAARFGVSRTPVREATLLLESLGLLVIRPRSGTYVVRFSQRSLSELFDIRLILESAGVRLASVRQRRALVAKLRGLMPALQQNISSDASFVRFNDVDTEFHAALVGAAENQQLSALYKPVEICVQAARSRLAKSSHIADTANAHHAAMIESIDKGDIEAFENHLSDHLAWVVGILLRVDELFGSEAP
jgi:DNA-binding GntR family transcriptional regulator